MQDPLSSKVASPSEPTAFIPAVEYVRMSTEHQHYSIAHQADEIRKYARMRGLAIIRTYVDEGKSGLTLQYRKGLQKLLDDVENGPDFKVILVFDVSRWGRFQDIDENAYYEYFCRKAGIEIQYCGEPFVNDGSPYSNILKAIKRTMAGEYSRELSTKIFASQCRRFELGVHQGGGLPYGLRRLLLDSQWNARAILKFGDRKATISDHVVLVPGPPEELEVIKKIFHWFVCEEGATACRIANYLNAMGLPNARGRVWTRGVVRKILTNEIYIGIDTYNRQSQKLKKRIIRNPPDTWLRRQCAFEPIVAPEVFWRAQELMGQSGTGPSTEHLLDKLREL